MGHKVLYLALEANKKEITGNVKMILREEWKDFRHNFFIVDGVVDLDELESIVIEGVLMDGIEKSGC